MNSDQEPLSSKKRIWMLKGKYPIEISLRAWAPWVLLHLAISQVIIFQGADIFLLLIYATVGFSLYGVLLLIASRGESSSARLCTAAFLIGAGPILTGFYFSIHSVYYQHLETLARAEVHRLCEQDGGIVINQTVDNIDSVFQLVDIQDQGFNEHDRYQHAYPWHRFIGAEKNLEMLRTDDRSGYAFIEKANTNQTDLPAYTQTFLKATKQNPQNQSADSAVNPISRYEIVDAQVNNRASRFGWFAEDLTSDDQRQRWIGGGRILIIDLETDDVLASYTGYFHGNTYPGGGNWLGTHGLQFHGCSDSISAKAFITTVLIPNP